VAYTTACVRGRTLLLGKRCMAGDGRVGSRSRRAMRVRSMPRNNVEDVDDGALAGVGPESSLVARVRLPRRRRKSTGGCLVAAPRANLCVEHLRIAALPHVGQYGGHVINDNGELCEILRDPT